MERLRLACAEFAYSQSTLMPASFISLSILAISDFIKAASSAGELATTSVPLGLAATLLNEMKAIPAGYRSAQDEFDQKETKRLEKIRAQWKEFEHKVRWAEREQKNRLKAAPVKAPIVFDE